MTHSETDKTKESVSFSGRMQRWLKDEHAVGLDICDGRAVAAHFVEHKGGLLLNALATETFDPGLSEKKIAQRIRSFWKQNQFPTRTVCTSLHSPSLIVRSFSFTNVLESELENVLSLQAEEALQLPIEDVSFSWQLNPDADRTEKISGTLIAVPRRVVRSHIRMITAAGLYPVNVEIACSAIINLYAYSTPQASAPVCLVSLTSHMAGIVMLANGASWPRVVFSSNNCGWGGNLSYLIESIKSALLQYQLKAKGAPASRLLLTGSEPLEKLVPPLAQQTGLPVEIWNPFETQHIQLAKHLKKNTFPDDPASPNLAVGLGLGLHHPKKEL
jgi:Tfp pilus assembly PilM family ATPase